MRAMIKVSDLTLRQWEWLQSNLKVEYGVSGSDVRVCVQFELVPEVGPAYREMSVRDFMALMSRLKDVHTCDHGSSLVGETPSMFDGADPVRDYADGCQSYGPYKAPEVTPMGHKCKCGFRAPELGPHPACPNHGRVTL